jgi:hypothetical protein
MMLQQQQHQQDEESDILKIALCMALAIDSPGCQEIEYLSSVVDDL